MKRYQKYTKELLSNVASKSTSIVGMMKLLGANVASGGTHHHLSKLIKKFEIDTSHFIACPGVIFGKNRKKTYDEVLVLRKNGTRKLALQLRRALIESGREYICECCSTGPIWNGKELRLQVDHKNGNYLDDRSENLRFICPNCHTQTPNYCCNKGKTGVCSYNKDEKRKASGSPGK